MTNIYWKKLFKREQIPELLNGKGDRPIRTSLVELGKSETLADDLLGLWRTSGKGKTTPLPQIILGSSAALQDLIAWTSTYVPGLSPLSSIVHLMTFSTFRKLQNRNIVSQWNNLASFAVGLMYGEVMSYAHQHTDIRKMDIEMCRSTLAYVLMRSVALGGNEEEIVNISSAWIHLRKQAGLSTRIDSCQLVLDIVKDWAHSQREGLLIGEICSPVLRGENETINLLRKYPNAPRYSGDLVGAMNDSELTAEQRVKIFDEIAISLVKDSQLSSNEKGMMLAFLAFWCRRGLVNQWAILQQYHKRLPQCAIWLGALQYKEPIADTIFIGKAAGWKLAIELFEELDLFRAPDEDISFFELSVGQTERQWQDIVSSKNRSRIKVGIAPCISTHLKIGSQMDSLQLDLFDETDRKRKQIYDIGNSKELYRLQGSLKRALREVERFLRK